MGVRQLQTYIKKSKGYVETSLIDECKSFEENNKKRPILVLDLKSFALAQITFDEKYLCGRCFDDTFKKIENLFEKLSEIADLVFVSGTIFRSSNIESWFEDRNEFAKKFSRVCCKINLKWPLSDIINSEKNFPLQCSNKKGFCKIAKQFGHLEISVDMPPKLKMAQFACDNPQVLAILSDDSDFLIYPGKWKSFSARELDHEKLTTKEYSRSALRSFLSLNDEELVIMSILNGNKTIPYEKLYCFHKRMVENPYDAATRFPAIAKFIKDNKLAEATNKCAAIACKLYPYINRADELVKTCLESYDINPQIFEPVDETQRWCRKNGYYNVDSLLTEIPIQNSISFFDVKRADYHEVMNRLHQKKIGVLFGANHEYEIHSKTFMKVKSIKPELSLPPLLELLNRPDYPEHDEVRFDLLKWLINADKLKHVNLASIPKTILLDIVVLTFMVAEGFIDVAEADILLFTIKTMVDGNAPESVAVPDTLEPRGFFVSHLFPKCFSAITNSFEIAGLKETSKIIVYNGVLFQNNFLQYIDHPTRVVDLLDDLVKYRFYA